MKGLILVLSLGVLGVTMSALAQPVTLKACETLLPLSQKWAEAYKLKHPDAAIRITGSADTPTAFDALAKQQADIVTVSRAMRFKEAEACLAAFGQRPRECRVGVIAVAVYVHADNPVTTVTYDELNDIFRGNYKNWKGLDGADAPINAYGQDAGTLPGEFFAEEILNRKEPAKGVRIMTESELRKAIARDTNGVGFGAFAPAQGIRALNIKRAFSSTPIAPGADAISNRIYPITRFIYCYVRPAADTPEAKAFLDWIRSDEGQQVGLQSGCWPLAMKLRTGK